MTKEEATQVVNTYMGIPGWRADIERWQRQDNRSLLRQWTGYRKEHVFRTGAEQAEKVIQAILVLRQE